jgi:hypothetical protein
MDEIAPARAGALAGYVSALCHPVNRSEAVF